MRNAFLIVGFLGVAVLAAACPASAAKPHKGARYLGFEGSETKMDFVEASAKVRVSGSGRRFRRGSYVALSLGCGRATKLSLAGTSLRRGEFSKVKRDGDVRYRLRGRFAMPDYARLSYFASSPPRDSRGPGRCRSGRRQVALYERGEPPFESCRSQRAKTDLQNGDGRVFDQLRGDVSVFFPFTYACLFSTDKRVLLGRNWDAEYVEVPRLTAPYVGFADVECGGVGCYSRVLVRDLRDGRLVRDLVAIMEGVPGEGFRLTDLELKSNASLAWLVDRVGPTGRGIEVVAVDSSGQRLLDSGPAVDPESLTLNGSTLTWRNGGVTRSATLD